jgi:hypothetical protein
MTFDRFLSLATLVVPLLLLFGISIGAYLKRHLEDRYRFLLIYLGMCLLIDVLSRIVGELYGNNLVFIIIFSLLELVFFYVYYRKFFFKRAVPIYTLITLLGSIFMLYEMAALKDVSPKEFQPYSKVICSFIIIVMSINCLFEKMADEQQDNAVIKLNSAFVIYFSLNLIFFLPVNFLINVASSVKFYFWSANLLLTISFYGFLCKEIWKNGSTRKRLQSGS